MMTVHEPAEKNLKHKTDVMSWGDVKWQRCDLNFRPPSMQHLSMSFGDAYARLALAAAVGAGACLFIQSFGAFSLMQHGSWTQAVIVAVLVAGLAAARFYRPLPRVYAYWTRASVVVLAGLCVILFYLAFQATQTQDLFAMGLVALYSMALPLCLFVADQMTGHMIYWFSAAPEVDRNTMVVWRNAWCGRFMTEHTDVLTRYGVSPETSDLLRRYYRGHVVVVTAFTVAIAAALIIAACFEVRYFVVLSGGTTSLALLLAAHSTGIKFGQTRTVLAQTLGHWLCYLKDAQMPPWVMVSPAGDELSRSFRTYAAVILLAMALTFLGLADMRVEEQTLAGDMDLSSLDSWVTVIIMTALAPLQLLLIIFIVSLPTISVCRDALQQNRDEEVEP